MNPATQWKAYTALACVCFFWGTTYLGIRMALESFPPAMLVAVRFLISGGILTGYALPRGLPLPRGRELWRTGWIGFLILGIGNGSLAYTEQLIPSGLASLFIALSPLWMVGIEATIPGGVKLHGPTIVGMLVGFAGTALLFAPGVATSQTKMLAGFAISQMGVAAWCFGSILQKRSTAGGHPLVTGAIQQLAAGISFVPLAILSPNHTVAWSARGVGAVLYLVMFGSIVGYSAYIYALGKLPVAIFSLYSYFNTVVAVTLGWLVYREPFGWREAIAMAVIFAGVGIVKWKSGQEAPGRSPAAGRKP